MTSIWKQRMPLWIVFALSPLAIAIMDWKYFFPLSAHDDFRFQLAGENFEVLTLLSSFAVLYLTYGRRRRESGEAIMNGNDAALSGALFAILTFAFEWRDMFPGDRFDAHLLLNSLWEHLFGGCFFGLYTFACNSVRKKPSKEQDKSVV